MYLLNVWAQNRQYEKGLIKIRDAGSQTRQVSVPWDVWKGTTHSRQYRKGVTNMRNSGSQTRQHSASWEAVFAGTMCIFKNIT